jgi:hypothetical protein
MCKPQREQIFCSFEAYSFCGWHYFKVGVVQSTQVVSS